MHYVVFLKHAGLVPYKDILDINPPGSYLPSYLLERNGAISDFAWRAYDLSLLALVGLGSYIITKPYSRFAGLWSACLFALIHGRDGLEQMGERDLYATTLIVVGTALLVWARRAGLVWPAFLFGLCAGAAITIKPSTCLFLLLPLSASRKLWIESKTVILRAASVSMIGALTPILLCICWLVKSHALVAFIYNMRVLALFHATLGHAPVKVLEHNALSPFLPIAVLWVIANILSLLTRSSRSVQVHSDLRVILYSAFTAGVFSYAAQLRGYPYHRYPFLIFFLLIASLDFADFLAGPFTVRLVSCAALLWSSFVLAPSSAIKAGKYENVESDINIQLTKDLISVAPDHRLGKLNGNVQCLDTVSGCIAVLDRLKLVQRSGQLYDEFLFHSSTYQAVRDSRTRFASTVLDRPPAVLIVTEPLFPAGPNQYLKLPLWTTFQNWLSANYTLTAERTFTKPRRSMGRAIVPAGYRLYVQNSMRPTP